MTRSEIEKEISSLESELLAQTVESESLKLTNNSAFGKMGSMWSPLYSPDMLIQVTVSGQLCLLLLIEAIEGAGISVVSANTDGVTIQCPSERREELNGIVGQWEDLTGFKTEEALYSAVYAKDVSNYIALKPSGESKLKGLYSNPWEKPGPNIFKLHKNPNTSISIEAVIAFLRDGVPLEETIRASRDIRKFVSVRSVTGGARIGQEYLGKAVRWFYALGPQDGLSYKKTTKKGTHNKVPKTDGAKPLMELPDEFPSDVNYDWYVGEAEDILESFGYFDLPSLFS